MTSVRYLEERCANCGYMTEYQKGAKKMFRGIVRDNLQELEEALVRINKDDKYKNRSWQRSSGRPVRYKELCLVGYGMNQNNVLKPLAIPKCVQITRCESFAKLYGNTRFSQPVYFQRIKRNWKNTQLYRFYKTSV